METLKKIDEELEESDEEEDLEEDEEVLGETEEEMNTRKVSKIQKKEDKIEDKKEDIEIIENKPVKGLKSCLKNVSFSPKPPQVFENKNLHIFEKSKLSQFNPTESMFFQQKSKFEAMKSFKKISPEEFQTQRDFNSFFKLPPTKKIVLDQKTMKNIFSYIIPYPFPIKNSDDKDLGFETRQSNNIVTFLKLCFVSKTWKFLAVELYYENINKYCVEINNQNKKKRKAIKDFHLGKVFEEFKTTGRSSLWYWSITATNSWIMPWLFSYYFAEGLVDIFVYNEKIKGLTKIIKSPKAFFECFSIISGFIASTQTARFLYDTCYIATKYYFNINDLPDDTQIKIKQGIEKNVPKKFNFYVHLESDKETIENERIFAKYHNPEIVYYYEDFITYYKPLSVTYIIKVHNEEIQIILQKDKKNENEKEKESQQHTHEKNTSLQKSKKKELSVSVKKQSLKRFFIKRKYSDFYKIHKYLKKRYAQQIKKICDKFKKDGNYDKIVQSAKFFDQQFPSKNSFASLFSSSNTNVKMIEERRDYFQEFLEKVLCEKQSFCFHDKEVIDFLSKYSCSEEIIYTHSVDKKK